MDELLGKLLKMRDEAIEMAEEAESRIGRGVEYEEWEAVQESLQCRTRQAALQDGIDAIWEIAGKPKGAPAELPGDASWPPMPEPGRMPVPAGYPFQGLLSLPFSDPEPRKDPTMKEMPSTLQRIVGRLAKLDESVELEAVENSVIRAVNMLNDIPPETQEAVRAEASASYGRADVVVDDDAQIIDNEEDGYWVEAWIFVPKDEVVK